MLVSNGPILCESMVWAFIAYIAKAPTSTLTCILSSMGVGQHSLGGSGAGDLHAQPPVGASLVNAQGNLSLDMSIWRCDRIGGSARAGGAQVRFTSRS